MTPDGVLSGTDHTSSSGESGTRPDDESPPRKSTTLYRFYDADDDLLYVGITRHGANRWRQHEDVQSWWPEVARTTVEHFTDLAEARTAELRAIQGENPRYNVAGRRPKRHSWPNEGRARVVPPGMRVSPNDLMDADEAAVHLGLSSSDTFYTYVRRFPDELTPIVSKGRYIRLWLRDDLDGFLERHPGAGRNLRRDVTGPT